MRSKYSQLSLRRTPKGAAEVYVLAGVYVLAEVHPKVNKNFQICFIQALFDDRYPSINKNRPFAAYSTREKVGDFCLFHFLRDLISKVVFERVAVAQQRQAGTRLFEIASQLGEALIGLAAADGRL